MLHFETALCIAQTLALPPEDFPVRWEKMCSALLGQLEGPFRWGENGGIGKERNKAVVFANEKVLEWKARTMPLVH